MNNSKAKNHKRNFFLFSFFFAFSIILFLLSYFILKSVITRSPESIITYYDVSPAASVPLLNTLTESGNESNSAFSPEFITQGDPALYQNEIASLNRVTYASGFYYEPIPDWVKRRMEGKSYKENCTVPYEDLRYMRVYYMDFSDEIQTGEIICHRELADDFIEIFYELFLAKYQIEKICLIDEYQADDTASMADNNTSSFNFREIASSGRLSKHAYGAAIDINPFYNPYCEPLNDYISPKGSEIYANRDWNFPHKIDESDLCYQLFIQHGFLWGGNWKTTPDYQHFQKDISPKLIASYSVQENAQ